MTQKQATNSALLPACAAHGAERVQHDAEHEEGVVGRLAADAVGQRGPEEPSADVEQRQQAGEAGGDGGDRLRLLVVERR